MKVFAGRGIGRTVEEGHKVLDVTDVVGLDLLREMTRRHVFDHTLAQWADGFVGHGDKLLSHTRFRPPAAAKSALSVSSPSHMMRNMRLRTCTLSWCANQISLTVADKSGPEKRMRLSR